MASPSANADALRRARARLAVLRHLRDELQITDPRTLNGREDHDVVRFAIDECLDEIDAEITAVRRDIGAL